MDHILCVRIKEVTYGTCDTIYLCKSSDTKQTYTHSEKCKNLCQPGPFFTHTIFDIVKRAAKDMTMFVRCTVFDSEKTFGIFRCHTKQGCNFHPE